jgi:hypothetical protein
LDILNLFLASKDWNSIVKNYFTELSRPFVLFERTITEAATNMLITDFESIALFYCLLCVIIVLGTMGYIIWRVRIA